MGDLSRRRPYISIHIRCHVGKKKETFLHFFYSVPNWKYSRERTEEIKRLVVCDPPRMVFFSLARFHREAAAQYGAAFLYYMFFFCWLVFVLLLSFLIYFVLFSPLSRSFSGLNPTHYQERKSSSAETHCLCFISLILVGDYELNRRKLLRLLLLVVIER